MKEKPQITIELLPAGGMIGFVVSPGTEHYLDILASLLPVFHVQLSRSTDKLADSFPAKLAAWFTR